MQRCPIEWYEKLHKYILSLMDILSRYHWMKPQKNKSSRAVACALKPIYTIYGPPERFQSNNGEEFKERTLEFCKNQKMKPIYLRSTVPSSVTWKVKRSHVYIYIYTYIYIYIYIYIYKLCIIVKIYK